MSLKFKLSVFLLVISFGLISGIRAAYNPVMLTMTEGGIGIVYHATGVTNTWDRGNNYSWGNGDSVAVVDDINGNGRLQLVRGRTSTTIMYEFDENGETFSEIMRPAAPGAYVGVNNGWTVIDIDNDGYKDLFYIRPNTSNGNRLYWSESDGTSDGINYHSYETDFVKVSSGYFDGSSYGDLFAITSDTVEWHKGNGPNSKEYVMQWNIAGVQDIAVGDFDGDGNGDLFMVNADGMIEWYKADGIKQSPEYVATFGDGFARCLIVGDVDQDGTTQLVVGRTGTKALISYVSTGIDQVDGGTDLGFAPGVSDLAWAVPEPASLLLFGLAGAAILKRQRRK